MEKRGREKYGEREKEERKLSVRHGEEGNGGGRPPVKGRERVQGYVRERGGGSLRNLEQARRECQDREIWKIFCRGHPLVGVPRSRC